MDFILNGQAHGSAASVLLANGFNPLCLKPFVGDDGRSYMNRLTSNGSVEAVLTNTAATLRKDEWIDMDKKIIKAAKPRLRYVADLRGAGLQYIIPNGMGKTTHEWETQSDITGADISMDGMRRAESDRPVFNLQNIPLPIIHKDFSFTARQIATARQSGSPLDTSTAELAARRVAETVEQLALGTYGTYAFGGGTIYGLTNFPSRNTRTITAPTASGWTPKTLLNEVLAMKKQSQDDYYYGPWNVYFSTAWDPYLDDDFSAAKGDITLRQRLKMIDGLSEVKTLDYLENYDVVLSQKTSDVNRMLIGMEMMTVQWPTDGGMMMNYKVMCIIVPHLRADYNGNCGIVHGTVA